MSEAPGQAHLVDGLLAAGADAIRINCAHDMAATSTRRARPYGRSASQCDDTEGPARTPSPDEHRFVWHATC
jgi:hypothetical protein